MYCISFRFAGVSRAGKVRGGTLPQEYILWQNLGNAVHKETSWTSQTPTSKWKYVSCNAHNEVTHLLWSFDLLLSECQTLQGKLVWENMPRTLLHFEAKYQALSGRGMCAFAHHVFSRFIISKELCILNTTSKNTYTGPTIFDRLAPTSR